MTRPLKAAVVSWTTRILVLLVPAAVLLFVAGVVFLAIGSVSGTEFSPQLFQQRSYHYLRIPFTHRQIAGGARAATRNDLMRYLTRKGLVVPLRQGVRWDAVDDPRTPDAFPRGDAALVLAYLHATTAQGDLFWLQWTKDHDSYGAVLWPAVARLARDGLYLPLPELFSMADAAPQAGSAPQFQQQVNRWLVAQYRWYAGAERQAGRPGRARQYDRQSRTVGTDPTAASAAATAERPE